MSNEPWLAAKMIWTDADFDQIPWHGVHIHGLGFREVNSAHPWLLMDLDHIVAASTLPGDEAMTFWLAPATILFEDLANFDADLKLDVTGLDIFDVHMGQPESSTGQPARRKWRIAGRTFELRFQATGFRMNLRRPPIQSLGVPLTWEERGGISYDLGGYRPDPT